MKLVRYENPQFPQVSDLDGLFNSAWPTMGRFGSLLENLLDRRPEAGVPSVDWHEDDSNYHVQVELPGVKKDAIELDLENAVLSVRAERVHRQGEVEERVTLARSVSIPEGVSGDKIKASYSDGILTVTLPKEEQRKPRKIAIN